MAKKKQAEKPPNPWQVVEEPVETQDEDHNRRWKITHPAFALVRASRVSGSTALFQSDFVHNHYVTLTIIRANMYRDLSNDWVHDRGDLIEINMSEAQWATFVSSLNVGAGTPCTLREYNGEIIPRIPNPKPPEEQFEREVQASTDTAVKELDALKALIKELGLPKGKTAQLLDKVFQVRRQFDDSIPFIAGQFSEHMEENVESARTEIHAYAVNLLMKTGLKALGAETPIELKRLEQRPDATTTDPAP